jgi:hypothetical protein
MYKLGLLGPIELGIQKISAVSCIPNHGFNEHRADMAGSYACDLLTHALDWKGAKECFLSRHNVQLSPVDVMSDLHKC